MMKGRPKRIALHAAELENKVFLPDGSNLIRVVRDPLDLSVPGADGHCGISGCTKDVMNKGMVQTLEDAAC